MKRIDKKIIKYCILFLVTFFINTNIIAENLTYDTHIPTAPTPKLVELGKYAEFASVGANGTVPVNIPLFNIEVDNYSHSFSLVYNNNGIKVNQDATWVGLGWNLIAGGSIFRSVRDIPDDQHLDYLLDYEGDSWDLVFDKQIIEHGWLEDPSRLENFPDITNSNFKTQSDRTWGESDAVNAAIALKTLKGETHNYNINMVPGPPISYIYDCEPDIFYLNIGDISLKFIFGYDGLPKLLNSPYNYKIEPVFGTNNLELESFIVTDNKGNKYYFGGSKREETTVTTQFYNSSSLVIIPEFLAASYENKFLVTPISKTFTTAWFLTKIELTNGNEINFGYFSPSEPLLNDIETSKYRTKQSTSSTEVISFAGQKWNSIKNIEHSSMTHYLNSITFPNGSVSINLSARTDLTGAYKIDNISLKNLFNQQVNQISFSYSYRSNRLFLDSVQNNDELFSFNYNSVLLPPKNSEKQDFWGYYCAKSTDLIPTVYVYPTELSDYYRFYQLPTGSYSGEEYILPGSDRSVDLSSIYAGILEEVIYPTGGKEKFIYEPNEYFDNVSESNIQGGGIRVAEIKKYDSDNTLEMEKEFSYTLENNNSSGVLTNKLAFATPVSYTWHPDVSASFIIYLDGNEHLSDSTKWDYFTLRSSNNYFPLANLEGIQVGYTQIQDSSMGNGKNIRYYHKPQNFEDNYSNVNTSSIIGFKSFSQHSMSPIVEPVEPIYNFYTDCSLNPGIVPVFNLLKIKLYGTGNYSADGYEFQIVNPYSQVGTFYDYNCIPYEIFNINLLCGLNLDFGNLGNLTEPYKNIYWGNVHQSGEGIFPFPPLSDDENLIYNKLIKEEFYQENESIPFKTIEYDYEIKHLNDNNQIVKGLIAKDHFAYSTFLYKQMIDANPNRNSAFNNFLSLTYDLYSQPKAWSEYTYRVNSYAFNTNITTTERREGNNIVEEKDMAYNSDFLLASNTIKNSKGENIKTEFLYPKSLTGNAVYIGMVASNMISFPIEKTTYNNSNVIDSRLTMYKLEDGNYVPGEDYILQILSPLASFSSYNGITKNINYGNDPENDYQLYNSSGNLIQYSTKGGITTAVLWDATKTYVMAIVKGVTHSQISSQDGKTSNYSSDTLWSSLNSLVPNALITTYSYKPLVGITSETDPAGRTTYYEYDSFGRLEYIRNHKGEIIEKYEYHYAN